MQTEPLDRIIVQAQRGDHLAFEAIVHRFQGMAGGYASTLLHDAGQIEDAVQEAFLRVYLDLPMLKDPLSFVGWFRRILYTRCMRMQRVKRVDFMTLDEISDLVSPIADPAALVEHREFTAIMHHAVQTLRPSEQDVVTMFYLIGLSYKDIAATLGVPVSTVKKRLYDARRRLRKTLGIWLEEPHQRLEKSSIASKPSHNGYAGETLEDAAMTAAPEHITWSSDNWTRYYFTHKIDMDVFRLARSMLASYPIESGRAAVIGHQVGYNGQLKFRIDGDDGDRFICTMHYTDNKDPDVQEIETPLYLLEALQAHTDLIVQAPVRNIKGQWIMEAPLPGDRPGNAMCTVKRWVEGTPLWTEEIAHIGEGTPCFPADGSPEMMAQLGAQLAGLHTFTSTWERPDTFKRPEYMAFDAESAIKAVKILERAVREARIRKEEHDMLSKTAEVVYQELAVLEPTPDHWGVIHGDPNPGNWVEKDGSYGLIDFEGMKPGYFYRDLTAALRWMTPDQRRPFLGGYRRSRSLPDKADRLFETFLIEHMLTFWAYRIFDMDQHYDGVRTFTEHVCRSFLDDKPFMDHISPEQINV